MCPRPARCRVSRSCAGSGWARTVWTRGRRRGGWPGTGQTRCPPTGPAARRARRTAQSGAAEGPYGRLTLDLGSRYGRWSTAPRVERTYCNRWRRSGIDVVGGRRTRPGSARRLVDRRSSHPRTGRRPHRDPVLGLTLGYDRPPAPQGRPKHLGQRSKISRDATVSQPSAGTRHGCDQPDLQPDNDHQPHPRTSRTLRGSADALGQRDDDPFRPPDVGHPPNALVLADATDQSVASVAAQSTAACRSLTSKATLRNPSSLAMASGEPGTDSGRTKLESSRRVPSSGGFTMTISVRESGMPQTVSKNSPSTNVLPSTCRPSATKKAVTTSRSATVRPTWSKRRTCDIGPSPRRGIDRATATVGVVSTSRCGTSALRGGSSLLRACPRCLPAGPQRGPSQAGARAVEMQERSANS